MADKQYLELCRHILENGTRKDDRTGTGTLSTFGYQMRFNLAEGFPLLTTKRVPFRIIAQELLWFVRGDTDIKYLLDNDVNIWNADAYRDFCENGEFGLSFDEFIDSARRIGYDLGPIYPQQWRKWNGGTSRQPVPKLREGIPATYLGVANGANKEGHPLKKTWEGMIARCYDRNSSSYYLYGAKGVHVHNDWLEFTKFANDAEKLPGWSDKIASETRYVLDKDSIGNGKMYGPDTCVWVTDHDNACAKSNKLYVVEKDGVEYQFTNPTTFCREQGISDKNFSDLWTGRKNAKKRHGFTLVRVEELRKKDAIDQIANVIESIRTNPDSRRHIVSAWNVGDLDDMALPPCHTLFQFYVADGKLSCQLYQRSGDVFLGVPFNIASYALLTNMIAHVTGLQVGEFVHTLGDAHIYSNHIEQVLTQLEREPRALPTLSFKRGVTDIDDFRYEDFEIIGYDPHPPIKGEVSVG